MVKFGPRKPSFKKSFSARTTGRAKRAVKRSIDPTYGKKGAGWIKDPKKAAYNKMYNKTTFSVTDGIKTPSKNNDSSSGCACGCIVAVLLILLVIILAIF